MQIIIYIYVCTCKDGKVGRSIFVDRNINRDRDRDRDNRQADRKKDRQTNRQTQGGRQADRQTGWTGVNCYIGSRG